MFKLDLEKAEEPEIKLPTSVGSWKKQESSRKTSTSALLTTPKPLNGSQLLGRSNREKESKMAVATRQGREKPVKMKQKKVRGLE